LVSGSASAPEARNDVERLVQELVEAGSVRLSAHSGDGFFMVGLAPPGQEQARCSCHRDLWSIGTNSWALHARLGTTRRVRFMRMPDPHDPEREVLHVQLIGPDGASLLRVELSPLYDEQNQPIAAQFNRWEELQARYGGREELEVREGQILAGS
jgi:hypothetical protein